MPGPKFPQGYPKYFHDIAAKLIIDRPAKLEVDLPIQAGYARSHFNYFRQSWLRQYEFMAKAKDHNKAQVALDTYNKLAAYEVKITPPNTLIFTSKAINYNLAMRETGQVEVDLQNWLPIAEDLKANKQKPGLIKLKNTSPEELAKVPHFDAKEIDNAAYRAFNIRPKHKDIRVSTDDPIPAPIILDNPPTIPPSDPDTLAFFLAVGRSPKSYAELHAFIKDGTFPTN